MNVDPALISNWIIFIVGGLITFVGSFFGMRIAVATLQVQHDAACRDINDLRNTVYGNGHDGLVKLVDRHEQALKRLDPKAA